MYQYLIEALRGLFFSMVQDDILLLHQHRTKTMNKPTKLIEALLSHKDISVSFSSRILYKGKPASRNKIAELTSSTPKQVTVQLTKLEGVGYAMPLKYMSYLNWFHEFYLRWVHVKKDTVAAKRLVKHHIELGYFLFPNLEIQLLTPAEVLVAYDFFYMNPKRLTEDEFCSMYAPSAQQAAKKVFKVHCSQRSTVPLKWVM